MNELKNFKERKLKNFREKFPVFLTRNYTADTLVGKFDEDGNLLPSEESERLRVFSEVEQFISDLIDEMETNLFLKDIVTKTRIDTIQKLLYPLRRGDDVIETEKEDIFAKEIRERAKNEG
jgi:hypothetical protein